mgnify:FL=1|jgi:hypothetical protein
MLLGICFVCSSFIDVQFSIVALRFNNCSITFTFTLCNNGVYARRVALDCDGGTKAEAGSELKETETSERVCISAQPEK